MTSEELAELMQEPAGGHNHGRSASASPKDDGRSTPLGASTFAVDEFINSSQTSIVDTARGTSPGKLLGARDAGMHAHRGVIQENEYVDDVVVQAAVEDELGFSFEQLHSVYSTGGRIPSDRRELRVEIDSRLLALCRSGANMDLFGRATGLNASTLDRALARARVEEGI